MQEHPIKIARETQGFTMRTLASRLPLGKGGHRKVWDWEHGLAVPSLTSAKSLAEVLGFESAREVRRLCLEWQQAQGICFCRNCRKDRASKRGGEL